MILICIFAFLLSNPTGLLELFQNIINSSKYSHDVSHSMSRLMNERWEWDVILANGFFDFYISLPSISIIILFIILYGYLFYLKSTIINIFRVEKSEIVLSFVYLFSLGSVIYLVFKTHTQYVWYWFCIR